MKTLLPLFILTMLIFSCTSKNTEEEQKKVEEPKENQSKIEKGKVIDSLTKKYNISYNWDTLQYPFSINYKQVIKTKNQLIGQPYVLDIYEKDTLEYATIYTSLFYFDFPISTEQESILSNPNKDFILVVNIMELKKIKLTLEGKVEDKENAKVDFGVSVRYIGKGKILDIVSLKNN